MTINMPLKNLRVLDLSRIWAGPYATKLLSDLGAEVIKLESLRVYDSHRGPVNPNPGIVSYPNADPGENPWNRNGWFNCLHMNKYGITLELTTQEGKNTFEQLLSISDVLVENFRQGSLERLGYPYEKIKSIRPDIIYASMPAFGNTGPWKKYLAYGIGQEQLSGMAHMTGYDNDGPIKSGINHGDPITGSHAAGVILAALRYRKYTGEGMYLDVSQQESAVSLIGGELIKYQVSNEEPIRIGNKSNLYCPHNVYPSKGNDEWITIAVTNDNQWKILLSKINAPELNKYSSSDLTNRKANESEIDKIISDWSINYEKYELTHILQSVGIPSAPVMGAPDLFNDPHYIKRETFETVEHTEAGVHIYPGIPWKMSQTQNEIKSASPLLGEHHQQIYGDLLGLSKKQLSELLDSGTIGYKPTGSRIF